MKLCIIGVNKNLYAPKRVFQEAQKRGCEVKSTTWHELDFLVRDDDFQIRIGGKDLKEFDAVFCRNARYVNHGGKEALDKRYLLRILRMYCESSNVYLFNKEFQLMNKLQQAAFFAIHDIPTLDSYYLDEKKDISNFKKKFPMVIKPLEGSGGRGIFLISNKEEFNNFLKQNKLPGSHHEIQKYYQIKGDIRVLALEGKILGAIKRIPAKDGWITNYSNGGNAINFECGEEIKQLALRVVNKTGLNYAGIDILMENNKPRVIELNEFAQFEGFEKATGINVAKKIVDAIMEKTKEKKNENV
ncbi:MAG: RimK family alpha-L-glutamate ligase [Candidatus Moranbacteria bacterium]|nr:RimK family alpha-L-glutamate ligase [Candidatus Moranbacteria bacterium]